MVFTKHLSLINWLWMNYLAIYKEKYCLIRREKGVCILEGYGPFQDNISQKNTVSVTGLETNEVILRNLSLKLKSKREVLAALPFQVENLLPYPSEELLLLPTLKTTAEGSDISLLATSKSAVSKHLKERDSDIVSCVPLALYRYARHFYPQNNSAFLFDGNTFIAIEDGELVASQFVGEKGFERALALMTQKFPDIPFPVIEKGPNFENAIPIGLALDAALNDERSGQFRMGKSISDKQKARQKKQNTVFLSLCAAFFFTTLVLGHLQLRSRERATLQQIGFSEKGKLSAAVMQLEESLYKQRKSAISISTLPKVSELLTWLSSHPSLQSGSSISRLRYQLLKTPRIGSQIKTQSAKIELELTCDSPATARSFHEALLKDRKFIDQKNPIRWNASDGIYRANFHIKPGSQR